MFARNCEKALKDAAGEEPEDVYSIISYHYSIDQDFLASESGESNLFFNVIIYLYLNSISLLKANRLQSWSLACGKRKWVLVSLMRASRSTFVESFPCPSARWMVSNIALSPAPRVQDANFIHRQARMIQNIDSTPDIFFTTIIMHQYPQKGLFRCLNILLQPDNDLDIWLGLLRLLKTLVLQMILCDLVSRALVGRLPNTQFLLHRGRLVHRLPMLLKATFYDFGDRDSFPGNFRVGYEFEDSWFTFGCGVFTFGG